jgi:hypothetical protein
MTHNDKMISKHKNLSFNRNWNDQTSPSASATKKEKSNTPSLAMSELQSLKAVELNKQNGSSILDLIVKAAAGEQYLDLAPIQHY